MKLEKCYVCGCYGSENMIPTTTVGKFICTDCAKKKSPEIARQIDEASKPHGIEMSSRMW